MGLIGVIAQYKCPDGKKGASLLCSAGLFFDHDIEKYKPENNYLFDKIYAIDAGADDIYLAVGQNTCDIECISNYITSFVITKSGIEPINIFEVGNSKGDSLEFHYRISNIKIKMEP